MTATHPHYDAQAALLHEAIDDGQNAIGALSGASAAIGAAFRGFEVARADGELGPLAENLGSLLVLTQTIVNAVHDLTASAAAALAAPGLDSFGGCLDDLLRSRAAGDWIRVADLLEYQIPTLLAGWQSLFEALRRELQPAN
jgi:hypothetical protein